MKKRRSIFLSTSILLTMTVPTVMAERGAHSQAAVIETSDARTVADQYLKEHGYKYNLKEDLSDLNVVTVINSEKGSYVRYQQTIEGAPVFSNQLTVTLNQSGKILLVVSDYAPYKSVEKIKNKISKEDAESNALKNIGAKDKGNWAKNSKEFGFIVEDGVAIPIYRVVVHTDEPFGAWETYIHAENGKLLKKRNLNQRATGTGQVFMPNPVASQGSITGLTDKRDADSTALNNQLKAVSLLGLDGSGYLKGSYVNIYSKAKTFSSSNTFNYTRSNDSFEDVNTYYHIDTLQRYIQSIGFQNINNRSIKANVNTYTQDNSFYSPSTKELTFGSGGVDDAEDAGIVAHEYGHSIQDNQVPGFGNSAEAGAMGEGFGDFLGATYEDSLSTNGYGKGCIGEWDATSYSSSNPPCLRRLDNNKVYPRDWAGEVHADGEIWSQGEYEMAQAFGRDIATKIILQSHFSLTPNATFRDGARAIKQADVLLYGGSHGAEIDSIWAARGISTN
ncbi:M36 family metallopeptidase [Gottfriedia acidiceleris]|uniref:M36 family metallopeptidase n=1 Tax=Gottfriedia acidiceleris TaxID=371036 RepID=UPI002FFE6922